MKDTSVLRTLSDALMVIQFASERGQPLSIGQNDPSQCVRYVEVPLFVYNSFYCVFQSRDRCRNISYPEEGQSCLRRNYLASPG